MKIFKEMFHVGSIENCEILSTDGLGISSPPWSPIRLGLVLLPQNYEQVEIGGPADVEVRHQKQLIARELNQLFGLMREFFSRIGMILHDEDIEEPVVFYQFALRSFAEAKYPGLARNLATFLVEMKTREITFADMKYILVDIFGNYFDEYVPPGVESRYRDQWTRAYQRHVADVCFKHGRFAVFGNILFRFAQLALMNRVKFEDFFTYHVLGD